MKTLEYGHKKLVTKNRSRYGSPCRSLRRERDSATHKILLDFCAAPPRAVALRLSNLKALYTLFTKHHFRRLVKTVAERARFELARGFRPYSLSKRAPSATQPSLLMPSRITRALRLFYTESLGVPREGR